MTRLSALCDDAKETWMLQGNEIEELKRKLSEARDKIKDLEATIKRYEEAMEMQAKKGANIAAELQAAEAERLRLQQLLSQTEAWLKATKLEARALGNASRPPAVSGSRVPVPWG